MKYYRGWVTRTQEAYVEVPADDVTGSDAIWDLLTEAAFEQGDWDTVHNEVYDIEEFEE